MENVSSQRESRRLPRETGQRIIRSLEAKEKARRTASERFADWMTSWFGSVEFLIINLFVFLVWLVVNVGIFPGVRPFDPFPFNLLTTVVSLEAIILAITVLISQNRAARIDDLRAETDLQVDIINEQEVTKLIKIVTLIAEKNGIDLSSDRELQEMEKPTDTGRIEKILEKQIE